VHETRRDPLRRRAGGSILSTGRDVVQKSTSPANPRAGASIGVPDLGTLQPDPGQLVAVPVLDRRRCQRPVYECAPGRTRPYKTAPPAIGLAVRFLRRNTLRTVMPLDENAMVRTSWPRSRARFQNIILDKVAGVDIDTTLVTENVGGWTQGVYDFDGRTPRNEQFRRVDPKRTLQRSVRHPFIRAGETCRFRAGMGRLNKRARGQGVHARNHGLRAVEPEGSVHIKWCPRTSIPDERPRCERAADLPSSQRGCRSSEDDSQR